MSATATSRRRGRCWRTDLYFKGQIDEYHSADDYLASLGKLAQIVTGTDVQKVVGDDEDVVTIYDPRVRRSARPLRAEAASPPAVAATR